MSKELKVGQALYWVPRETRFRNPREVTVTKIGRKWVQLDNRERIDIESLCADGGQYASPGQCYLSKADYEHAIKLSNNWTALRRDIESLWKAPNGVTLEDMDAVRSILKISA